MPEAWHTWVVSLWLALTKQASAHVNTFQPLFQCFVFVYLYFSVPFRFLSWVLYVMVWFQNFELLCLGSNCGYLPWLSTQPGPFEHLSTFWTIPNPLSYFMAIDRRWPGRDIGAWPTMREIQTNHNQSVFKKKLRRRSLTMSQTFTELICHCRHLCYPFQLQEYQTDMGRCRSVLSPPPRI